MGTSRLTPPLLGCLKRLEDHHSQPPRLRPLVSSVLTLTGVKITLIVLGCQMLLMLDRDLKEREQAILFLGYLGNYLGLLRAKIHT